MSACLVVKRMNDFVFAVDTAIVSINPLNGKVMRKKEQKLNKLKKIGKDVVFVSGFGRALEVLEECIEDYLNEDGHLDIQSLHKDLLLAFPASKNILSNYNYYEYGIDIFRFENGVSKLYEIDQLNEIIHKEEDNKDIQTVQIYGVGFNSEKLLSEMENQFKYGSCNFASVFQKNYSEEVGNHVRIYKFDNDNLQFVSTEKLKEVGLDYEK